MIRPAALSDAKSIAALHIRAWQAAYRGIVSDNFLDSLSTSDRTDEWIHTLSSPESTTLVHDSESISGWICFGRGRDSGFHEQAEIYALYIDPLYWRSGIGRKLLKAAEVFLGQGFQRTYLWVLTSNSQARRFYESVGYVPTDATKSISWAGTTLEELRYIKSTEQDAAANP